MEKASITLTETHHRLATNAVAAGEYASLSEVIRDALREWEHKRQSRSAALEALRIDVQAGLDDIAAGRVSAFDANDIKRRGREQSAATS